MSNIIEIKVPDIGDATDVDVIEVLVSQGDTVAKEDSLITLEGDKATMEIPSPNSGVIDTIKVKVGDKVSEGSLILTLKVDEKAEAAGEETKTKVEKPSKPEAKEEKAPTPAQKTPARPEPAATELPSFEGVHAGPAVRRIALRAL